jgi:hypothetical protein
VNVETIKAIAVSLALVTCLVTGLPKGESGQVADDPAWNRRPAGSGDYQIVLEVSGRNELALFVHRPSALDLSGPCTARQEAVEIAIPTTRDYLAGLVSQSGGERDEREIAWTHYRLGQLWSHEGLMDRAVEQFEAAHRIATARAKREAEFREAELLLEATIGVAHLRRGELENCVHDHHAASCIFPLREEAQHHRTSGSEMAMEHFLRYLKQRPDNLEIRWLLNVAAMTLGRYPEGVPKAHLIPPDAFASAEDPGQFLDVAGPAGLGHPGRAGGVVVDDLDNDGLLDIVISSVDPCEPLRYFRNEGDGTFRERTVEAGLSGQLGGINITQTDYNNDGWLDLFVMRGGWEYPMRNSLLRNNGDGTFTDVTEEAGLASALHRTHSAAWADFDNDGWLDLFVGHEETPPSLFRNQGDGTFVDVAREAGVARAAFTKGVAWGDVDGNGYPDLYVSNYGGANFLYRNNGDGTFTDQAAALGVEKPLMSFPTWFWDYDNDGRLDLFVASFVPSLTEVVRHFLRLPRQAETMKLYRNVGGGRFEDVTAAVGLDRVVPTMGANFGDINNDGFLDIYLGTGAPSYAAIMPNFLFQNRDGRAFVDVTTSTGTGHLQKGHGVAFADLDGSGYQDIFTNIGGFVPGDEYNRVLFRNPGQGNNWIQIRLVGVRTNRAALGARITVILDEGDHPDRRKREGRQRRSSVRHREVTSGGSFGASPLTQHIGLGKGSRISAIEVFWPASGTRQRFENVGVNQRIEVTEFEKTYRTRPVKRIPLGDSGRAAHD